jgi:hypothetical protein
MKEPFDLLRVAMPSGRQDGPIDEAPNLQPSTFFNLQLVGKRIVLETEVELDYWEVDPAWDGRVFRSAAQAVRPPRKGNLPKELALPVQPGGEGVCVRLVGVRGEVYQMLL